MNKRYLSLILLPVAGLISLISWLNRPEQTVRMAVPWQDEFTLAVLRERADAFEEGSGKVKVRLTGMELGELNDIWKSENPEDSFDLAVASSSSFTDQLPGENHFAWTGVIWALYYNKAILQTVGWEKEPPSDFLDGTAGLEDLESVFGELQKEGYTPFSAGGRYVWPLAALIQHLILYEDPQIDLNSWDGTLPAPEAFEKGWERYENWRDRAWITRDSLSLDWPASILKVTSGEAAFVLIPSSLATTIPPEMSDTIGLIPFPAGKNNAWIVGSLWELAVPAEAAHSRQALRLARYLAEGETVSGLQDRLNRRFFPRENLSGEELHTSITGDLRSPFMEWTKDRLR